MTTTILYVGSLRLGGNGLDRIKMFKAKNFKVNEADRFEFMQSGTRIEQSIAARKNIGLSVNAFNKMLKTRASHGGYDIVFIDKGVWIWPEVLKALKASAGMKLAIHYTPDAQFLENRSRHFFKGLPNYDLAVTTKPFEMDHYQKAGAQQIMLIEQGYGQRLQPVAPSDIPEHLQSEVCFVGHYQPHYAQVLKALSEHVPVAIWGPNWPKYAKQHPWAQGVVRGEGVYGADYPRALSGAKIALGLLSKRIPETTTTRTFEIPACGTMLLAERTAAHQSLFEEGREAEFFDKPEEAEEKVVYYLANNEARETVAAAGLNRCHQSGYSTAEQFGTIVDWIQSRTQSPTSRS